MAATAINGVKVVATEPALTNLRRADDTIAPYAKVVVLVLETGEKWFGCVEEGCEFVTQKSAQTVARRHYWGVHMTEEERVAARRTKGRPSEEPQDGIFVPADLGELTLTELLATLSDTEFAMKDRENLVELNMSLRRQLRAARAELDRMGGTW